MFKVKNIAFCYDVSNIITDGIEKSNSFRIFMCTVYLRARRAKINFNSYYKFIPYSAFTAFTVRRGDDLGKHFDACFPLEKF